MAHNYIQYSSKLLEQTVQEFSRFPGIGNKTALRMVLHLLRQEKSVALTLGETIIKLAHDIKYCPVCQNISDTDVCSICSDKSRDGSTICVVETIREVISIENTHQFRGLYHVLGGNISPMDGIGPKELKIAELGERLKTGETKELIIALSTTMEGDTTAFYLYRKFHETGITISSLARGISVGDELEYTDEVTLGRSIINRVPFKA